MKITVYITSYNQKDLLIAAIESVLSQTLQAFEIIIVDDCSTDSSQDLIKDYASRYPGLVKPIFHNANLGIVNVRRAALDAVTGDYVTYLDGDDIFLPKKLEIESLLICDGKYDIAFSNNYYFTKEIENIQSIWAYNREELPEPGNMYVETFARKFPRTALFRMELVNYKFFKEVGFHDQNLKIYEDDEMRLRLSKKAKINFTMLPLSMVRMNTDGLSKSPREVHLESLRYVFAKHKHELSGLPSSEAKMIRDMYFRFMNRKNLKRKDIAKYFIKRLLGR